MTDLLKTTCIMQDDGKHAGISRSVYRAWTPLLRSPEAAWQIQGVQPRKKLNMMLLSAQLCNGACKPSICEVACMRSKAAMTCETVAKSLCPRAIFPEPVLAPHPIEARVTHYGHVRATRWQWHTAAQREVDAGLYA